MTKEQYRSITQHARRIASRLPFGAKAFSIPTYLCAAIYIGTLCLLLAQRDSLPVIILMSALCLFISALRVFTGKHYPSDVIAALLLAGAISCLGYAA